MEGGKCRGARIDLRDARLVGGLGEPASLVAVLCGAAFWIEAFEVCVADAAWCRWVHATGRVDIALAVGWVHIFRH